MKKFFSAITNLPSPKNLAFASLFTLALLYPGDNQLQTVFISQGVVKSYTIPSPSLTLYPVSDNTSPPTVSASSYIIQDLSSKTIIASKNPDAISRPASITKLMTALVALDTWPDLDQTLTVLSNSKAIGQTIDLFPGESLTVKSLLDGLLIHSGNDAALTLADNYPTNSAADSYQAFVKAMNQKALDLHLTHTTYKNPSGIDQYGHTTTARDIAVLANIALRNPVIEGIITKPSYQITDITGSHIHKLSSTDELLTTLPGLRGGKTGWTSGAGECFVSYVERDGHGIITVVLGSANRFGDTTQLVEWVYSHHSWQEPKY